MKVKYSLCHLNFGRFYWRVKRQSLALLALFTLLLGLPQLAEAIELDIERGTISGRVYDATTNKGIPDLVVKLIPSRSLQSPQKITITNQKGEFRLTDLKEGIYLIEIYQGVTILYRSMLNTAEETHKVISLRRKE